EPYVRMSISVLSKFCLPGYNFANFGLNGPLNPIRFLRASKISISNNMENFSTSAISSSQRKVDVGSVQINVEVVGNGPQTLLCLPGVLGTIESDFTPQLKDLQKDFRVVAWDPPGYGKSRPPPRDFSGGHLFYYRDAHDAH
ncbi:unnamed protein product, partial [Allacma fusca]